MSHQQRLILLPLAGAILLCLLAIAYLVVRKRSPKPEPGDGVAKHTVDSSAEDVLKYWTPDKKRHARPAPMPDVTNIKRGKKQPRRPPHTPDPRHA